MTTMCVPTFGQSDREPTCATCVTEIASRDAEIERLRGILKNIISTGGEPCRLPDHKWEVAGEAYTNCCNLWIHRSKLQAMLGAMRPDDWQSEQRGHRSRRNGEQR